jgi:hypothetical protein
MHRDVWRALPETMGTRMGSGSICLSLFFLTCKDTCVRLNMEIQVANNIIVILLNPLSLTKPSYFHEEKRRVIVGSSDYQNGPKSRSPMPTLCNPHPFLKPKPVLFFHEAFLGYHWEGRQ